MVAQWAAERAVVDAARRALDEGQGAKDGRTDGRTDAKDGGGDRRARKDQGTLTSSVDQKERQRGRISELGERSCF